MDSLLYDVVNYIPNHQSLDLVKYYFLILKIIIKLVFLKIDDYYNFRLNPFSLIIY